MAAVEERALRRRGLGHASDYPLLLGIIRFAPEPLKLIARKAYPKAKPTKAQPASGKVKKSLSSEKG